MGREKLIFSSSVAMALASKRPIQMGTARFPSRSFRITMGVLVSGSMVRPDTFISTNIYEYLQFNPASHREGNAKRLPQFGLGPSFRGDFYRPRSSRSCSF